MDEENVLIIYPNVLSSQDLNDIEKLILSDIIRVQLQGNVYNFASRIIGFKFNKSLETIQEIFQDLKNKDVIESIERKGKSWIRRVIDIERWVGSVNDTITVQTNEETVATEMKSNDKNDSPNRNEKKGKLLEIPLEKECSSKDIDKIKRAIELRDNGTEFTKVRVLWGNGQSKFENVIKVDEMYVSERTIILARSVNEEYEEQENVVPTNANGIEIIAAENVKFTKEYKIKALQALDNDGAYFDEYEVVDKVGRANVVSSLVKFFDNDTNSFVYVHEQFLKRNGLLRTIEDVQKDVR